MRADHLRPPLSASATLAWARGSPAPAIHRARLASHVPFALYACFAHTRASPLIPRAPLPPQVDPSGVSYRYFATAIGKGKNGAKSQLEKLDLSTLTCREAVIEAAKVIYTQHDPAKDKPIELELSWACDESNKCHQLVPAALHAEAEAAAKAHREAMDED